MMSRQIVEPSSNIHTTLVDTPPAADRRQTMPAYLGKKTSGLHFQSVIPHRKGIAEVGGPPLMAQIQLYEQYFYCADRFLLRNISYLKYSRSSISFSGESFFMQSDDSSKAHGRGVCQNRQQDRRTPI